MKKRVSKFIYDMITIQPVSWNEYEYELVSAQIPDFKNGNYDMIKAQKIVSDYRKTIYEIDDSIVGFY